MKTDLYDSIEAIADKVTRTAATVEPPKRGIPRIISDVQLVPPRAIPGHGLDAASQNELDPFSDLETWMEVTSRRNRKRQVRIDARTNNIEEPDWPILTERRGDHRLPPNRVAFEGGRREMRQLLSKQIQMVSHTPRS